MANTTSTLTMIRKIRSDIYNFRPTASGSVSASLGDRLYINQPPDNVTFPYAILRLVNQQQTDLGDRKTVDLEVTVMDRPRVNTERAELVADFIDGALLRYTAYDGQSVMWSNGGTRDTIPPLTDPADREVVMIRLVYPLIVWPQYLTQYSGSV